MLSTREWSCKPVKTGMKKEKSNAAKDSLELLLIVPELQASEKSGQKDR